jgi:DNA-binding CsgD family transcriptional regulator
VYATGFTNIIDIAFDRHGRLLVLEIFKNGLPSGDPTGSLVRIAPRRHSYRDRQHRLAYRLWRAGGRLDMVQAVAPPFRMMIDGDWAGAAAEWSGRGAEYLRVMALSDGDATAAGEALRILDRLGAVRAAADVRARLRERGISGVPRGPRRTTSANAAGLTARQLDVLALLADGLSNAEIAARLTLSPKTVDHHISAVLDKLGVANRTQAVSAAHRLNLLTSPDGHTAR